MLITSSYPKFLELPSFEGYELHHRVSFIEVRKRFGGGAFGESLFNLPTTATEESARYALLAYDQGKREGLVLGAQQAKAEIRKALGI